MKAWSKEEIIFKNYTNAWGQGIYYLVCFLSMSM